VYLKQEAWILYLRVISVDGKSDIFPFWGRVIELKPQDVVWSDDVRKFICLVSFHKDLDMLVVDDVVFGNPEPEYLEVIEKRIISVTKKIFKDSDFNKIGKKSTKGFVKNSIIYTTNIPDCIKSYFKLRGEAEE
jgi:hypothetical protein